MLPMRLHPDQPLPDLGGLVPAGDCTTLAEWICDRWAVVLFYRGHW